MSILVFTQQQRTQGIVCTCQGPEWVYVCIVWQSLQSRVKQAVLERVTEQWSEILICTEHIEMLKGKPHERELFPTIVKMKKVTCMYITTAAMHAMRSMDAPCLADPTPMQCIFCQAYFV